MNGYTPLYLPAYQPAVLESERMSQAPPGPPTSAGTISPDGAYIWNGTQWIPNAPGRPGPQQGKGGGHGLRNVAIGCAVLIVLGIVGIIALAGSIGKSTGGTASHSNSCSPKPCANADGFTVTISSINRNAPKGAFISPEAGNHIVTMQVTMHNGSSDKQNANPFDFKLRDPLGQEHDIAFSDAAGCDTWQAVDLAAGASLGPKPLCFEAAGDPNGKLILVWSPGFFQSPQEIPLQ